MEEIELTKIDSHDELLELWESKFAETLHFNKDGVISQVDWENSPVKILFVLKETNKAKQNIVCAINRALTTKKSGWWKGKVLRRVGRWSYGLLNYNGQVPNYREAKRHEKGFIKNIAYINMRKSSGGARTNKKSFNAHVEQFAPFIRKQIEILNPDIVVLGGTYKQMKSYVFPELEKVSYRVHKHGNALFINAFHPAAIKGSSMLYHQVLDSFHQYRTK